MNNGLLLQYVEITLFVGLPAMMVIGFSLKILLSLISRRKK